jgi:uncharacterized protein (TIGR01777 family)
VRLVRTLKPGGVRTVHWDPATGEIDAAALEGLDAALHLAGESIAGRRWTRARKQRIRQSRVEGTRLIARTLAGLGQPPRVLVCASAVGFYGDRGDEILTEESPPGAGFFAEVCSAWEAAADPARQRGIRVAHVRTSLVLDPRGGALARLLPIFRWGLGAPLGSGRQWWSWVSRADLVAVFRFALENDVAGPINAASPQPVRCSEFTRTIGRVLGRPTWPPVPRSVLRLLAGEMADAALLASARLDPRRLVGSGFRFRHPALEPALREMLHRPPFEGTDA